MYFAPIDNLAVPERLRWLPVNGELLPLEGDIIARLHEVEREMHYLVKELPKSSHLSICAGHHFALFERAGPVLFGLLLRGSFRLWGFGHEARTYQIVLKKTVYDPREGELSLDLLCGDKRVFTIAFTLLPGSLFQLPDRTVATITRIQGIPHRRELVHETKRAMNEVAAPHALLAALKGVCEAFGVDTIIGCPSRQQIKFDEALEPVFTANYEDFFAAVGATQRPDGYFALAVSSPEKPLSEIKRGHRIRTRLKRAVKAQILASSIAALRNETEADMIVFEEPDSTAKRLLDPVVGCSDPDRQIGLAA